MDDYKFERVWNQPERTIGKLRQYQQVITPDFSLYTNMPVAVQLYQTFRRRWCGAYWQAHGIRVIPAVGWAGESSFDFCFEGIETGSAVAISTLGTKRFKEAFLRGYGEMCKRLKPSAILCYCRPFPEIASEVIALPHEGEAHKMEARRRAGEAAQANAPEEAAPGRDA